VTIQRRLIEKSPDDEPRQSELSRGLFTLAEVVGSDVQTDRSKEAEAAYAEAVIIQEKLVAKAGAPPHYRRDLANTYGGVGLYYQSRNREEKAIEAFKNSAAAWEKLAKAHPGEQEYAVGLSNAYFSLGNLAKIAGRPKEAEPWFTQAVQCFDLKNPSVLASPNVRTSLSNAFWWRADSRTKLTQHEAALKDWDKALEFAPPINKSSIRLPRAAALARAGKYVEATAEASELMAKVSVKDGETLFRFARVYALSATAAKDKKELTDEYVAQAFKLLTAATNAGYFKTSEKQAILQNDPALQVLRDRPEFKRLTSEIKLQ